MLTDRCCHCVEQRRAVDRLGPRFRFRKRDRATLHAAVGVAIEAQALALRIDQAVEYRRAKAERLGRLFALPLIFEGREPRQSLDLGVEAGSGSRLLVGLIPLLPSAFD